VIEEAAPAEPAPASLVESPDPSGGIFTSFAPPPKPRSKLIILGYANTHGTRYFLLPAAWLLALLLVQKPVGQGTLALCMISILNVLEIIDANNLRRSALGPIVLALLGSFYFFKTGHQAVLSTIQWETAFIPFKTIIYPFSPLVVLLNTFGPQILCAIAVPAIPLWKTRPKYPGLLGRVAGAMATHMLFYAAIAVATVIEAAWLRRHLMLYRIFMPRMLMGVTVMMVVEIVAALVAIMGVRWSVTSVADVFGWER
jgi:phosphatidylinositol glycan class O